MTREPQPGRKRGPSDHYQAPKLQSCLLAHPFSSISPLRGFSNPGILINGLLSVSVRSAALCYRQGTIFYWASSTSFDVRKRLPIELASAVTHSLGQPSTSRWPLTVIIYWVHYTPIPPTRRLHPLRRRRLFPTYIRLRICPSRVLSVFPFLHSTLEFSFTFIYFLNVRPHRLLYIWHFY